MKLKSKKLTTMLCVACLLGSVIGGPSVYADELDDVVTIEESAQSEETSEEDTIEQETTVEEETSEEETTQEETTEEETTEEETTTEEEMTEEIALFSLDENGEEDYVDKLPTNVRWAKRDINLTTNPQGLYATFQINSSEDKYRYFVYLFKDGEYVENPFCFSSIGRYSGGDFQADVIALLQESGKYSFRIGMFTDWGDNGVSFSDYNAVKDNENYSRYLSDFSDEYEVKSGLTKLAAPVNVKYQNGLITWDLVPNAEKYCVRFKAVKDNSQLSGLSTSYNPVLDISSWNGLVIGEEYEFHISAVSNDLEKYANSDETIVTFTIEEAQKITDYDMTTHEYQAPTELTWSDTDFGRFSFKVNDNVPGYYVVRIYRDNENGNQLTSSWWMSDLSNYAGSIHTQVDKHMLGYENGNYWFNVTVFGLTDTQFREYMNKYSDVDELMNKENVNYVISEKSPVLVQNAQKRLDQVKNITWSDTNFGSVSWSPVENASYYSVTLYRAMNEDGSGVYVTTLRTYDTVANFATYTNDSSENYGVSVRAMSLDTQKYLHSEWVKPVPMKGISTGDTIEEAKKELEAIDNLGAESTPEAVNGVVDNVKNIYSDSVSNLQNAMQNDDEVLAKIEKLEELYAEKNNVTTTSNVKEDEVGFGQSDVSIVGAGLNARPNTTITFNVEKAKPENNILLSENKYANAVQFNLDMTEGETKIQNLDIPVTITMPIPAGVNPDKLVILHQTPNSPLGYDLIRPKISADKQKATFTVTHFSTFAFAEEVPVVEDQDENSSGGTQVISDNGAEVIAIVDTNADKPIVGNSYGWDGIELEIKNVMDKVISGKLSAPVLNINLNGKKVIPEKAVKAIAGKNITVSIKVQDGIIVNIDGRSISEDFKGTISFATTVEKDGNVKVLVRNSVTDISKTITVFAKAKTGMTEAGLYFVDTDGTLISFGQSAVMENGYLAFVVPFVSADYVIK